jgi:hypothetical protein
MAGEFVRTPKKGTTEGRYRAAADLPMIEIALGLISAASTVAAIETGHWFAAPFAMLFTFGYGYVATLRRERAAGPHARRSWPASAAASLPPAAPVSGVTATDRNGRAMAADWG